MLLSRELGFFFALYERVQATFRAFSVSDTSTLVCSDESTDDEVVMHGKVVMDEEVTNDDTATGMDIYLTCLKCSPRTS